MDLDKVIRKVPDFPKPGILFYDVTSIFLEPTAFKYVVDTMLESYKDKQVDGVISIESRGFLLGSCFAYTNKVPLVLARKKGKLPGKTISQSYLLEYGSATLEIHEADLIPGKNWLIIDDLIATGGTLEAVSSMIETVGANVAGIFSIIGLPFLNYKEKIGKYRPKTLIEYNSEEC
ncbi:adenine phosphoribosyltransferase [Chitinispirillales bacterium ANBcel5]|uniref:adenine phosphoribosyltransferase n=1 Tax=Cellulosispirillum alkaliphilum TaxID=3039283 RepID=UPI002A5182D5|nr:adenine phosphoribosyltransferase [Chitinispirillales bacterium ANBcel5]